MSRGGALERALAAAFELIEDGREDWLEEACDGHPELREDVERHVRSLDGIPDALRAPCARDPYAGLVIGDRYELLNALGAGAMGVVHRARDRELGRFVAVKLLRGDMVDPVEAGARFLREAEAMASIRHEAVVRVYDRGHTDDGRPFIVMELLEGASLADILDEARRWEGPVHSDDAGWIAEAFGIQGLAGASYLRAVVRWTTELASGLAAVHRAGVLHRDVKPSNVFIRADGQPVLLDFGIAAAQGRETLTREGTALGTPIYMSPEALDARASARPTADVYGLAATLYHMLTLRPPYSGSATQVFAAIATRDPVPAARLRPGLPRDLDAVLAKGLERSMRARYASAGEFESDLRAFLEHRPVSARHVGPLGQAWRRVRRSRLALGALASGLLALAVLGASEVRQARSEQRARVYREVAGHLPPNFTFVGADNRTWRHEDDRRRLSERLDQAVELAPSPLPARLLRSSFRLDHGDPVGAADDLAVVADHVGTGYAEALAARYAALSGDASGAAAVDTSGMPEPSTGLDLYLHAYHLLRAERYAEARAVLADPNLAPLPHAEELRLVTTSFQGLDARRERDLAARASTDAIRLEERLGGRTAATAHILGRFLAIQGRYEEALEVLRDGVQLADRSAPLRINQGMMAWRLGLDDEARRAWGIAIDLQPQDFKPYQNLIWLHLDRGEFEEVELLLDRAPLGDGPEGEATRLMYLARIETERALEAFAEGDSEAVREHAERAAGLEARAGDLRPSRPDTHSVINAGLLARDPQAVFTGLARLLREDPLRWRRLARLLEHMPRDLDPEATDAVREFVRALHDSLASTTAPSAR